MNREDFSNHMDEKGPDFWLSKSILNPRAFESDIQIIECYLNFDDQPAGMAVTHLIGRHEQAKDQCITQSNKNKPKTPPIYKEKKEKDEGQNENPMPNRSNETQLTKNQCRNFQTYLIKGGISNLLTPLKNEKDGKKKKDVNKKEDDIFYKIYVDLCNKFDQTPMSPQMFTQKFHCYRAKELHDYFKGWNLKKSFKVTYFDQQICKLNADANLLRKNIIFLSYFVKYMGEDLKYKIDNNKHKKRFLQQNKTSYYRLLRKMQKHGSQKLNQMIEKSQDRTAAQLILGTDHIIVD